MKNILFCTNLPSPYRVDFFNEFGKYCDLTVLYERHSSSERDKAWRGENAANFKEIYLDLELVGVDRARGGALRRYIKHHPSDVLIFTNYVSPATMEAILWCRLHNRQYYIEYDGGFNKKDGFLKSILKRILLKGAKGHLTTADEHINYLKSLGIPQDKINKYPFTSVREKDILDPFGITKEHRDELKNALEIAEEKVVLAVGQMIYRKGIDILLKASVGLDDNVGVYIIGGKPNPDISVLKEKLGLNNVHFVDFKVKQDLAKYYMVADVFVFPTREDIWGLVVNEAMAYGIPIVSSRRAIAAQEMIGSGVNGIMAEPESPESFHHAIKTIIENPSLAIEMGNRGIARVKDYTIEKMALAHKRILIDSSKSCSSNV